MKHAHPEDAPLFQQPATLDAAFQGATKVLLISSGLGRRAMAGSATRGFTHTKMRYGRITLVVASQAQMWNTHRPGQLAQKLDMVSVICRDTRLTEAPNGRPVLVHIGAT